MPVMRSTASGGDYAPWAQYRSISPLTRWLDLVPRVSGLRLASAQAVSALQLLGGAQTHGHREVRLVVAASVAWSPPRIVVALASRGVSSSSASASLNVRVSGRRYRVIRPGDRPRFERRLAVG